jgi:class 3 adenylate cyclase/predicted ATPase
MFYIFEGYSLDTDRRELRRGGDIVALQPQVFDLLQYLIANRDRVVSKDDMLEAVWAGRLVSESTLATRINAARTAVGDNGDHQRLIRTLPRKGIRFVGAVQEELRPGDEAAKTHAVIQPETPERTAARWSKVAPAERRQVTIASCELLVAAATGMDPEDLREIIESYHNCVVETIRRHNGAVASVQGNTAVIHFGYPQAHEDDPERAVRAALELVAAVATLKTRTPVQTRVGIATGLVVIGCLEGLGEAQERGIVGETPNLAARLQDIAEPNAVVIADDLRRLIGNLFELEDLGTKETRIATPVRAWKALRPSSAAGRFEAFHATGLTDLVGREEELELLLRRWSRTKAGAGQVVLLSGEAGIGKSRLTVALLEAVASEPQTRLRYFCSPQHTDSTLYPIITQMQRAAGFAYDDPTTTKLDKLDALLGRNSTSREDAALLAEMLSLPNDERYPTLELVPQQRRQKTLEALGKQMEALSRSNPVVMIFEELFSVLFGLFIVNLLAFNGDICRDLASRFLALAEKQRTPVPLMIGHRIMGVTLVHMGHFKESRAHSDQAIGLYDPVEHRALATRFGSDSGVTILGFRSLAVWCLGFPEAALTDADHALEDAREIGQAATLMLALCTATWTQIFCGNYSVACSFADELVALAGEKGAAGWKSMGILQQCDVLASTGKASVIVKRITAGVTALRATGQTTYIPWRLSHLARAYADLGLFDDAWRSVNEAMKAAEVTKERMFEAEIHRVAGEIAVLSPEPQVAKAEAHFERALEVARQQQAKSWELRASMSLSRLWRDQGKVQQARELLAQVYGWFTEGFDTRDLKEAKALLEELAS